MSPNPPRSTGRFITVVGPSGAGKDSLIDAARAALGEDGPVRFVQRCITRPAEAGGEAHRALSDAEFETLSLDGGFALHWDAHGLRYGIPCDIEETLASGRNVLANLSRSVLPEMRERYSSRRIIVVTASPETLAARLAGRGRETKAEIAARLQRASATMPTGPDVVTIQNEGRLDEAVKPFLDALTG